MNGLNGTVNVLNVQLSQLKGQVSQLQSDLDVKDAEVKSLFSYIQHNEQWPTLPGSFPEMASDCLFMSL